MKFGKTLRRLLHTEWALHYINYKQLKQYIQQDHSQTYQQQFIDAVYAECNKINTFYTTQLQTCTEEFATFCQHIQHQINTDTLVSTSMIEQLSVYIHTYDRLRSFIGLNQLGFTKVLKKYDKHNVNSPLKQQLMSILTQQEFYSSIILADTLVQCTMLTALLSTSYAEQLMQCNISPVQSTDFQCAICISLVYEPVVLTCAHTFCRKCLLKTHQHQQQTHQPCCPTCRKPVYVNDTTYNVHMQLSTFIKTQYQIEYNNMYSERTAMPKTPPMTPSQPQRRSSSESSPIPSPTKSITCALNDTHMTRECDELDDLQLPPSNPTIPNMIDLTAVEIEKSAELNKVFAVDSNGIYVSSSIDVLLKYNHLGNQLYCIVDIDETLHVNPHKRHGCMLMTERGLQSYQHVLAHSSIYSSVPIPAKNKTTRVLQAALASKECVEVENGEHTSTLDTIHQLQAAGCYVFALTARYASQADTTRNELLGLNIDLSKSTPWPAGCELHDRETDAHYSNGVIYTSATEKGVILDRFLNGLFKQSNDNILSGLQVTPTVAPPTHMLFIDDRYSNCMSVHHGCAIAKSLNLQMLTVHYTYCNSEDDVVVEEPFDIEMVQCQIHHFLHTNQILNDTQAGQLLKQYKAKQAGLVDANETSTINRSPTRTVLAC